MKNTTIISIALASETGATRLPLMLIYSPKKTHHLQRKNNVVVALY